MNEKIIFEILKYVAIFFVSTLFPKKITYFIRNIISYFLKNCFFYWYYFLIETILFIVFFFYAEYFIVEDYINFKTFIFIYLITILIINLYVFFKFILVKSNVFFSIYPAFTIKENEFIVNDIQSEKINEIIDAKLQKLRSRFFVFRNKIIKVELINIPVFFPILLGFSKYLKFINRKLNSKNPISLYFQKDLLDSELRVQLFFNDNQFVNAEGFKDIEDLTLQICQSKERNFDNKVESILLLYMFICGQSFLDLTLDAKEYDDTLNILYDLQEQLAELKVDFQLYKIPDNEIDLFINLWKGMLSRYYSIAYLEKKENIKAIDFIMESNNFNPYFPYNTYEKGRQHYINKYLLELIPSIEKFNEVLEIENNETQINNKTSNLLNKLEYQSTTHNYQILIEIINRNKNDKEILNLIEKKLEENLINNTNVFSLIFIAETYKYLPLGNEMENKIYVNRIPKVVEILEKAIIIDSEFELLHLRIGSLKFMYGMQKSEEEEMKKSAEYIKKYVYLYSKYGL